MLFNFLLRLHDLFTEGDRAQGVLPPELEGKSPLEVAQYYQQREAQNRQNPPNRNDPPPPPPPPPPITREAFDADPLASTRDLINRQSVSREEYARLTAAAQGNLVATAKMVAREGKEYWLRLLPDMERIAQTEDPLNLVDPNWWITTYNFCVGRSLATLRREDAERAAAAQSANESGAGPGQPPPPPRVLSSLERELAAGFGMDEEKWRNGETKMKDGRLPVTLDNRRKIA